ncbi:MAG: Proteasome subunit alpha type-2 [Chaenotheca gracillima]|nr:MAG: Proteasome subunit alpha type-2 [Chaenotheca gracillima]
MDREKPSIPIDPLGDFSKYHHARMESLSSSEGGESSERKPPMLLDLTQKLSGMENPTGSRYADREGPLRTPARNRNHRVSASVPVILPQVPTASRPPSFRRSYSVQEPGSSPIANSHSWDDSSEVRDVNTPSQSSEAVSLELTLDGEPEHRSSGNGFVDSPQSSHNRSWSTSTTSSTSPTFDAPYLEIVDELFSSYFAKGPGSPTLSGPLRTSLLLSDSANRSSSASNLTIRLSTLKPDQPLQSQPLLSESTLPLALFPPSRSPTLSPPRIRRRSPPLPPRLHPHDETEPRQRQHKSKLQQSEQPQESRFGKHRRQEVQENRQYGGYLTSQAGQQHEEQHKLALRKKQHQARLRWQHEQETRRQKHQIEPRIGHYPRQQESLRRGQAQREPNDKIKLERPQHQPARQHAEAQRRTSLKSLPNAYSESSQELTRIIYSPSLQSGISTGMAEELGLLRDCVFFIGIRMFPPPLPSSSVITAPATDGEVVSVSPDISSPTRIQLGQNARIEDQHLEGITTVAEEVIRVLRRIRDGFEKRLDAAEEVVPALPRLRPLVDLEQMEAASELWREKTAPIKFVFGGDIQILKLFAALYNEYVYHLFLQLREAQPEHNARVLAPHLDAIFDITKNTVEVAQEMLRLGNTMRGDLVDLLHRISIHPQRGVVSHKTSQLAVKITQRAMARSRADDNTEIGEDGIVADDVIERAHNAMTASGGIDSGNGYNREVGGGVNRREQAGSLRRRPKSRSLDAPPRIPIRERENTM